MGSFKLLFPWQKIWKFLTNPGIQIIVFGIAYLVMVSWFFDWNWFSFPELSSRPKLPETVKINYALDYKDIMTYEKDIITYQLNYREAFIKALSGLAVLIGLWIAYHRLRTANEEQMTNRFAKAVELLANEDTSVRLGALYALERIANDSEKDYDAIIETMAAYVRSKAPWPAPPPDKGKETNSDKKDYDAIIETIAAYVRSKAPWPSPPPDKGKETNSDGNDGDKEAGAETKNTSEAQKPKIKEDISVAIHILGRRKKLEHPTLFLNDVDLSGLQLTSKVDKRNFSQADFRRANLSHTGLYGVNLAETYLCAADLTGARLYGADLYAADFEGANLTAANLKGAYLEGADLTGANLTAAKLIGANLTVTNLKGAYLEGANLEGSYLNGAELNGAKYLTWEQLAYAKTEPWKYLKGTALPDDLLENPPDWYKAWKDQGFPASAMRHFLPEDE